ncbi:PfkB family carbohydrate kinase [Streptomyces sp. NPDC015139]|uniref:PfkB family carbohydrate kinase n=1 Tax=Streptomyces sp. NPDC015139 TaxID=3364942 RepID=UPI0036FEC09E
MGDSARVPPPCRSAVLTRSHLDETTTRGLLAEAVRRGVGTALATRGLDGAIAHDGRTTTATPASAEDPDAMHDTMGCGDAFLAGFVVSLLRDGWSRRTALPARALDRALRQGAQAAYHQCFVEAAFGCGRPTPSAHSPRQSATVSP